ncbi:hypothetical protein HYDPIDRAFT_115689 [Hydnomerulius pinastri MD-312]|uniref:F-box domain-containing protein n=1 Tax=Hydnomerulius pinastri MD-312 TaxID=994086 RepID=A0A0C9V797_9AGAM|nr:hypothetical protein HYDPIDRAFT_115689 [Hydnomerulius pinastri MD-312]
MRSSNSHMRFDEDTGRTNFAVYLQCLAEELLINILSFLPFQDILRCAQTCRTLCAVAKGSIELQYLIELGANGLTPVAQTESYLPTTERLQLLLRSASAWNNDRNVPIRTHTLSNDWFTAAAHFTGGCLGMSGNASRCYELVDMRHNPAPGTPPRRRWTWEGYSQDPGDFVCCVSVDASQDVLVVASFLARRTSGEPLFRLDTFPVAIDNPRPSDAKTRLYSHRAKSHGSWRWFSSNVRIYGQCLAFCGAAHRDDNLAQYHWAIAGHDRIRPRWSLQIWNWQTEGPSQECVITGECTTNDTVADFSFLDTHRLILLKSGGQLEVYSFADLSQPPELQRRYSLPIPKNPIFRLHFTPPDVSPPQVSSWAYRSGRKPPLWATNLEDQVLGITLSTRTVIIISIRAILHPCLEWEEEIIEGVRSIPWLTWGPSNSRCFTDSLAPILCGIHGSRVVLTYHFNRLTVADFNPWRVRRSKRDVVSHPTMVENTFLEGKVTTCLPYAESVQDGSLGRFVSSIHLDEDGLVLVGWAKLFSR